MNYTFRFASTYPSETEFNIAKESQDSQYKVVRFVAAVDMLRKQNSSFESYNNFKLTGHLHQDFNLTDYCPNFGQCLRSLDRVSELRAHYPADLRIHVKH